MLEDEKITEVLEEKVRGTLEAHHKFKVEPSECPDACSQIQITDFALHGVVRVEVNPKACSCCGSCLEVCEEEAIELTDYKPRIDEEHCVGCGHCVKIYPEGVLIEGFKGYRVYVGGKLGRHPRLATFLTYVETEKVLDLFQKVLRFYKTYKPERGKTWGYH